MFPVCVCVSGYGVFGWRVEKMEAVQLDSTQLGVFYTGDAYIILNKHRGGADLHMWMGEESSRDEQCACAMLVTQLDQFLGGDAVQYRQEQGEETDEFMQLFPNGVSYKRGGVESGFRKVEAERVQVRHLYQVKGKKNIRVREVELNWRSFNTGDCFILDLGQTIVSWSGRNSSVFERQKVHQIAALIRDTERNGKAQICDVTQGEEPPEMIQALGPVPAIKDSSEEDSKADRTNSASLYKVSDAVGRVCVTRVADKAPFHQKLLQRDDCFILDNGSNNKIFIWKGIGANEERKRAALKLADEFIVRMSYCKIQTQVELLHQGRESVLFKHFFYSWT
ncbi:capping protein (actin filament), gelsolin-like a [Trichomycterus rosablanca]|uniref:capping protein (actin filament), gelsolin-like a n=1 Tax=Trichomycterus rosablanca TaxID=2290929 RepID=UPI002F354A42